MDFARLGRIFRAIRIKKRWRQEDVGQRAGVSRWAVSRLERGKATELGVKDLVAIATALEVDLKVTASWRGGELDRLLNSRHSALHESVARWMAEVGGWELAPEVSFSIYGDRGVIDIFAWHAATHTLLVIELKTEIVDVNDLIGRVDVKVRHAAEIARERGWQALRVAAWVIVADGSTNRKRVAAHRTMLRTAFPADGQAMRRWLPEPGTTVRGLSFWSNVQADNSKGGFATIKRVRRPVTKAA